VCTLDELLYPLDGCTHKLCLKCAKGVCYHAGTCPFCRAEFSTSFKTRLNTTPTSVRDIGTEVHDRIQAMFLAAGNNVWAYGDRKNKGYWLYDEHTQSEIKTAIEGGAATAVGTACGCSVTINVIQKTQENHSTGAIRRTHVLHADTRLIKGIAGMPRTPTRI